MQPISLIIPTRNEEGNILYLARRIDNVMRINHIRYEIIFIDDHSTDLTQETIQKIKKVYPIQLHLKKGKRGKAQSLIEGFTYAKYDIVGMIDADLQYPPETIPVMLKKIHEGYDIVVADRKEEQTNIFRTVSSKASLYLFGRLLHRLPVDVQSGLKIFRKEITERLTLNPSPWSFDLEFLVKARHAGYSIISVPMRFEKRFAGKSKVNFLKTSWDIASCALSLKFTKQEIIPFHKSVIKQKGPGFHYKGKEFINFTDLSLNESAFFQVTNEQKIIIFLLIASFLYGLFLNWHVTIVLFIGLLTCMYFADLVFNLYLILKSLMDPSEIHVSEQEINEKQIWPMYTIFCPLYNEGEVLQQYIRAIENLDYPKNKLQVILLLEADDKKTITKAKNMDLPAYFEIRIPPLSQPKTKPKALNYGLQFAKGEYAVVYDAEDIPDPLQLKKVILAFQKAKHSIRCIQAKLNFYNPFQNILTRVFTAEYSLWFDLVLTGLQSSESVIPLGGTSNHFYTKDLKMMHGWDAFNVTEDCDLGLRLVKNGYQTAIVNSTTLEEANSNIVNWFNQRGRWIKGYMQTYLVHVRTPRKFIAKSNLRQFLTFQLVVGGKILSLFINPLMWAITIVYFAFRPYVGDFIQSFFPTPIMYMGVLSLVFGNFLYLYYYMIGCAKREQYSLIKYAFVVPIYWLAMSFSGWHAFYKIITQPHYWAKTHHGLHLKKSKKQKKQEQSIAVPAYSPQVSM